MGISGAIILAGCAVGLGVFASSFCTDIYRQRKLAAQRASVLHQQRMEDEAAAWRFIDADLKRQNTALQIENAKLRQKIRNMQNLMAAIKLKEVEERW